MVQSLRHDFPNLEIQLFRADRVAGSEHLSFAARGAIGAFRQNRARSRTLAVELLLYASCQRQISKAIELLGLASNTHEAVFAAITDRPVPKELEESLEKLLQARTDDTVIEISSRNKALELMKVYDISKKTIASAQLPNENEVSVLKRLIIERSALLTVEKK